MTRRTPKEEGEVITVQASTNGRKITLDPLREKVLPTPWREVESSVPCGFRAEWVSGEREGAKFSLMVGAGVGSPWMTFAYRGRDYCINVKDILDELFIFADEANEADEANNKGEQQHP